MEKLFDTWSTFRTDTDRITWLLLVTLIAILIGVVGWSQDRVTGGLGVVASSGVGALLGLLFSIPKRNALPESAEDQGESVKGPYLAANTSLEEVSDWITKTIVGAGLVSWASVLGRLDQAGLELGKAVLGEAPAAQACGVALILAAAIHGGMCAYLWFSRYLPKELTDALNSANQRLEAQGLSQKTAAVAPATPGGTLGLSLSGNSDRKGGSSVASQQSQLQQAVAAKYAQMRIAPIDIEDWALGMFGGESSIRNNFGTRSVHAEYAKIAKGAYRVTLTVEADPSPKGPCVFFLHNTFPNTTPSVGFEQGKATLSITAWGAFTVGVIMDDGTTELELNLAADPAAPREFVLAG